jgi:hypothetical protein
VDIATALITVDIFAGAIAMSTLTLVISSKYYPTFVNIEYVLLTVSPFFSYPSTLLSKILAIAALLFTISLYVAFFIMYVLRAENRDTRPSLRRGVVCTLTLHVAFYNMFAGFIMLNVCLIVIGEAPVGWAGIALLSGIPFWFIVYATYERHGLLEDNEDERIVQMSERPSCRCPPEKIN